jgi:hypothetical protein
LRHLNQRPPVSRKTTGSWRYIQGYSKKKIKKKKKQNARLSFLANKLSLKFNLSILPVLTIVHCCKEVDQTIKEQIRILKLSPKDTAMQACHWSWKSRVKPGGTEFESAARVWQTLPLESRWICTVICYRDKYGKEKLQTL